MNNTRWFGNHGIAYFLILLAGSGLANAEKTDTGLVEPACYGDEAVCLEEKERAVTPGVVFDTGNFLDMSNNQIINLPDPVDPQDAATRGWVLNEGGDDLGDHTATGNIQLNGNWLSGDGASEGIFVGSDGNVGIGAPVPVHKLQIEGGNVSMGWESVNSVAFGVYEHTVPCNSDKYVTGGGCICLPGGSPVELTLSYPVNSFTWACRCSDLAEVHAYAICASIR